MPRSSLNRRLALSILAALSAVACKKSTSTAPQAAQRGQPCSASIACSSGLVCTDTPAGLPPTPGKPTCNAPARHYTFRGIAGVSMGAIGSSRLTAQRPDLFDAVGALGGPLDAALILRNIEIEHMGGFCTSAQLEAAAALDAMDNGNRMDRPDGIAGCTQMNPPVATNYSRSQRFNHWAYTTNGGHFDRDFYLDVFTDLTEAFGNPLSQNPNSPSIANPMTPADVAAASCSSPFVVHNVYDPVYSPHGEHNAITFCDGEPPLMLCADDTQVDWCAAAALNGRQIAQQSDADTFCAAHGGNAHEADQSSTDPNEVNLYFNQHGAAAGCWASSRLVPFALAIDINGNGRRDYNEPLLKQGHEPFQDVGVDGCPDSLEDGKGGCTTADKSPFAVMGVADPNGDNYDPVKNPGGTEGNWIHDPGEPFSDVGLDGVANTGDVGEGDGKFTTSPGYAHWFAQDLRTQLATMTPEQKAALSFYLEGGIRDVFDLGAQAEATASSVLRFAPTALNRFDDFPDIPSANGLAWNFGAPNSNLEGDFDPLAMDTAAIGKNALVLYGDPNATVTQMREGNGDHVGDANETYDRFVVYFQWVSAQWNAVLGKPQPVNGQGQESDLIFQSTELGAPWDWSIMLPPGYDDPANANQRYPVVYVLHGYGMSASGMAGTGAVASVLAIQGLARPMITVYPSGHCCLVGPSGDKVCRDNAPDGQSYQSMGYVPECVNGTFFVDRQGVTGESGDQTKYAQALFELMTYVDANYRTLPAADGQAF